MSNFDNYINKQFENYSPEVPPGVWDNIIAERESRRPKGFWFTLLNGRNLLIAAGVFLAIGTGAWFIYTNAIKKEKETGLADADKKTPPTSTNIVSNTSKNIITHPAAAPLNNDVTVTSPVYNNGISSPLPYLPQNNGGNTSLFSGAKNNSTKSASAQYPSDINSLSKLKDVTGDNLDENPELITANGLFGKLFIEALQLNSSKTSIENLRNRLIPNLTLPGCPSIEGDAAGNKRYVEVYGGPDIGFRSFTDTGNSAYLQQRRESTKFSSAFSAGIRYTKVFNNGMSLRTGVNYSQINEKFELKQGNVVQVTYIINAQGDTTGSYTVTGTRYKTTYNRYRTVDVPLVVGYELGNGKLHANLNAGAIINVYSWQRGDVLDAAGNPVNITTGKNGSSPYGFKTNVGVGFTGAVSVYYKVTEKMHLMAEPYYRHNFSAMNKENLTLKQKYNTAGLRIGVRLDLQ